MRVQTLLVSLLLFAASTVSAQVTSNVLYRVLRIRYGGRTASGFTINHRGHQYLVTARHVVQVLGNRGQIELWQAGAWQALDVTAFYPSNPVVDAAALDPGKTLTVDYPLEPTSNGLQLAQQVYFLGYPSGLATRGRIPAPPGFDELPFVKAGIISAMDSRDPTAMVLYVDGHNNPGFSGGPIVFRPGGRGELRVAGVVLGYKNEALPVLKKEDLRIPVETWLLLTFRDAMRSCQNQANLVDRCGPNPALTCRLNRTLYCIN